MNCIILLLLLSCCGGNNLCGCQSQGRGGCSGSCGRSENRNSREGRRESGREKEQRGCEKKGERRQEDNRGNNSCGQQNPSGCSNCNREDTRGAQQEKSCDIPGMVPPPWQEYPPMPRREKCDCDS